ncbi:MAG: tyrosine-type recombinase/integrase [Planctomycetota bacterium]
MKKPRNVAVGRLKAYAKKPPLKGRDRWYWQVVYHEGQAQKPVKGRSGRYSRREVKALLQRLNEEGGWKDEAPAPAASKAPTIARLLKAYLKHEEGRAERGRIAQGTHQQYVKWRKMLESLDELDVRRITLSDLQGWVDELEDEGKGVRTIQHAHRLLGRAWKFGRSRSYVPAVDLPAVELPRVDGYTQNHVTPSLEDAMRVQAALPPGELSLIGEILLSTGARIGEACGITWRDYDAEALTLHLDGKTGPREVPVGEHLAAAIEAHRERSPQKPYSLSPDSMRSRFSRVLAEACEACKVNRYTPHGLRRLASTRLIRAQVDPKAYEAQMGHQYAIGLRLYAQTVGEDLDKAAAVLDDRTEKVIPLNAHRRKA